MSEAAMKHGGRLHKLRLWLDDRMFDLVCDGLERRVEKPAQRLLCRLFGHEPVRDMCGRTEHDHCAWCSASLPGQAGAR